jgi:hypothetical protein
MENNYDDPASPAAYNFVGYIQNQDKLWLQSFHDRLWRKTLPDRFQHAMLVESDGVRLTTEELDRIFSLIRSHKLITGVGCGTFGLPGYSFLIYDNPEICGFLIPKPECLFVMTHKHLPVQLDIGEYHQKAWDLFSQFAYSDINSQLRIYHDMKKLENRSYYDY